jgi:RNA polymerase sigma-70 factor (ECF subfamily)
MTYPKIPDRDRDPREAMVDYIPSLRAFAISLARDRSLADDIVQDTLIKAWRNIDKYVPGTNLQAWLFTILRNTFYSFLRKRRHEVEDPDGVHAAKLSVAPDHDSKLAFGDFMRAFDRLSPEHREVLVLVGASGFSTAEAAEMMGVAEGTVKSRANRARLRLAELMRLSGPLDAIDGTSALMMSAMGAATRSNVA